MGRQIVRSAEIWQLARQQHGVVSRAQLTALGLNDDAIRHRCSTGRLRRVRRGVFLVDGLELSRVGALMAAVLACGEGAALRRLSAGELYEIVTRTSGDVEVVVPARRRVRQVGVAVMGRDLRPEELGTHRAIPLTAPAVTLVDLATTLSQHELEGAVNEADKLDLIDPETLRAALEAMAPRAGIGKLRRLLDRDTFTLTDSELERLFKPIARAAGLPEPLTQQHVCGYRVDFYWPDLGLVVETDGLRYHRTAYAQARDRTRDQAMTAAGLIVLRFTHAQVRYERLRVIGVLATTARRIRTNRTIA